MPYDPDWESDEEGRAYTDSFGAAMGLSLGADSDGMDVEEGVEEEAEQLDEKYEQHAISEEREDMDVDLPRPDLTPHPGDDQDAKPRNHRPSAEAAVPGRPSKLEVVLHSSPRRDVFTVVADDLLDGDSDQTKLVTSDIVPQRRRKRPEGVTAQASVAPAQKAHAAVAAPLPTITPQPKKKGRPFGWRLGSGPYSAMRAGLPPGSYTPRPKPKKPASEQKQRRRPGRKPAPTARQIYLKLNPHFVAFRCEWENCPAELQNLETLRKHLLVVHGRPSRASSSSSAESASASSSLPEQGLTCKWANCADKQPNQRFSSQEAFAAHIETAHLAPFVWHVGDGPRNSTPSPLLTLSTKATTTTASAGGITAAKDKDPLPSYLFDAHGNQVTPSVRDQQFENEDDRKKRQSRISRIIQQRDSNAPEEPDFTQSELEEMAAVMSAKRAKQRMFREYAERVCGAGEGQGKGQEKGAYGPEWRGILA
ncbi:hypothetical protein VTK56DRAFT_10079 [Thermocarpiscus australiensis]